ncbi:MAG: SDR family oxidoreductase, partial [Aestuariivirgaceae bacterium]
AGLAGYPFRTPYASAKWAVIGFTKSLAAEVGPWNIRVNAICPGSVAGERMDQVIAAEATASGRTAEAVRDDYTKMVSLRRFVEPEEIADATLFLASPGAKMISGEALSVDGHAETYHSE